MTSAEVLQTTRPYFQDLNEYCLLEIFARLEPKDLCSLADTCARFKQITQRVFPKEFEISIGYYGRKHSFTSQKHWVAHLTTQDVERLLTNFGQCLSTLSILENDSVVMDAVAKFCGAGTLKRMHIHTVYNTEDLKVKFKSISERLLALSFNGEYVKSLHDVKSLNLNFDSLVNLEIMDVKRIDAILLSTFPKLERFIFRDYYCEDSDALLVFLVRHKNIRCLDMGVAVEFSDAIAKAIGNNCKKLEELTLRNFCPRTSFDYGKLRNLSKLKMLEVDIGLASFSNFIQPIQLAALLQTFANSLEIVKILIVPEDPGEVIEALSQMPNLRTLSLKDCSYGPIQWTKLNQLTKLHLTTSKANFCRPEDVLNIVTQLVHLRKLKIKPFVMTEDVYTEIVNIVELRPNVLKFKCGYSLRKRFLRNCDENQKFELIK